MRRFWSSTHHIGIRRLRVGLRSRPPTALPRAGCRRRMAHFEGCTWNGWHHHVTLVSGALAFCTPQRLARTPKKRHLTLYCLRSTRSRCNGVGREAAHSHASALRWCPWQPVQLSPTRRSAQPASGGRPRYGGQPGYGAQPAPCIRRSGHRLGGAGGTGDKLGGNPGHPCRSRLHLGLH